MKTLIACFVTMLIAAPAFAQVRPAVRKPVRQERGFISINGGAQGAPGVLRDSFIYELHVEDASVDADYPGKTAPLFDAAFGVRVWRRYGLGLALTHASTSGTASVSARLPHPLYVNQYRSVQGEATDISRSETAAHVQVYYDVRLDGPWRLRVFAGPSFFSLEQEVVEGINVNESYPYDAAEFGSAKTRRADGSGTGFNAGMDLGWMFSRRIGAGALVRYTRASVDLNAEGPRTVSLDGGGFQVGGGLRFVF